MFLPLKSVQSEETGFLIRYDVSICVTFLAFTLYPSFLCTSSTNDFLPTEYVKNILVKSIYLLGA